MTSEEEAEGDDPQVTWQVEFRPRYLEALAKSRHVGGYDSGLLVVDLWLNPDAEGAVPVEALAVVTVRPNVSAAAARPFMPAWQGLAWETDPAQDPGERFMEAMRQGHLRHRERHTGETGVAILPR